MRLPSLFKLSRNKSYNYSPRYYDERKERIEKLRKSKEAKPDGQYFDGYRKKSYRDDWKTVKSAQNNRNRRLRFIVILIFLLIFAYTAVKYGKIDMFF